MTTAEEILEIFTRARETIQAKGLKPPQLKRLYEKAVEIAKPGTQAVVVSEIVDQVTADPGDETLKFYIKKHVGSSSFRKLEQAQLRTIIAELIVEVEAEGAAAQVKPRGYQVKTGNGKMTENAGKVMEDAEKKVEEAGSEEEKPAASKAASVEEPAGKEKKEEMEKSLFVPESESDSE